MFSRIPSRGHRPPITVPSLSKERVDFLSSTSSYDYFYQIRKKNVLAQEMWPLQSTERHVPAGLSARAGPVRNRRNERRESHAPRERHIQTLGCAPRCLESRVANMGVSRVYTRDAGRHIGSRAPADVRLRESESCATYQSIRYIPTYACRGELLMLRALCISRALFFEAAVYS